LVTEQEVEAFHRTNKNRLRGEEAVVREEVRTYLQRQNFGFTEVTTHRVPLTVRFFHPSGLGAWLRGTYVNQDGEFQPRGSECCVSGSEDFWVVDAGISYRLPRRYGFLTIGVTNLLDEQFRYQETDLRNPTLQPARAVFARLTLAFP
jgi:hypothetical protein